MSYQPIKMKYVFIFLMLNIWLIFSCTSVKKSSNIFLNSESYCTPPHYIAYRNTVISLNSDSILVANKALKGNYLDQNILIINALELNNEVTQLIKIVKEPPSLENKIKILEYKTTIHHRLLLAESDINAVSAELDCEGERIGRVAKYLDDKITSKTNKFTVASIVLGAASSIAGVILSDGNWNSGVTIGGGILGAGLGFAALNPKGKKVLFSHKRNLLKDIWTENNVNCHFPSFVWYMLSEKKFSNAEQLSLIHNEKKRWVFYLFNNNEKKAVTSVIFSEGGIYKSDDLHIRVDMINQLQSEIRSLNQNLSHLILEMGKND